MERIYIVAVGGNDEQAVEGKYVGTDGAKAQAVFDTEAQDGNNSIVRFFHFPQHSQVRTPKRDGVPPKTPAAAAVAAIPANREEYVAWLETLQRPALAEEGKLLGVEVKPGVSNVNVRAALLAAKYPPAPAAPAGAAGEQTPPAASQEQPHGDASEEHDI